MASSSPEIWKQIPGLEEYYEVSNLGRVRSFDRVVRCRGGKTRLVRGRELTHRLSTGGYPVVTLKVKALSHHRPWHVHQLVMRAFVGPAPSGMEVCHNDGDKLNCHLDNLRYDTRTGNLYDRVAHGQDWQVNKTHCKHGHEFAEANTIYRVDRHGRRHRRCRACQQKASRSYGRRRRVA